MSRGAARVTELRRADAVESPYLTAQEAVTYLRLKTLSCLYYHVNHNRLPTCRRGGRYLFDRRELDAWLRGTTALDLARQRRRA